MVHKERTIKMIERAKEKADECDVIAVTLMNQTSEFLEDSLNNKEITIDSFNDLRHRVRTMSNQFSRDCGCNKKGK